MVRVTRCGLLASCVLACGWLAAGAAGAAEPVGLRDLTRITRYSSLEFSPDGRFVVAVESRADLAQDHFVNELVLVDVARHATRALTWNRLHADQPHFSPDGGALGFIALDAEKTPQVFSMPLNGGDALQITHAKDGVDQYAWSPDGHSIAFAAADAAPERKGEAAFDTAFEVRNDDFTLREAPRPSHVWIVPAAGGVAKRLTSGSWSLPTSLPPGSPSSPLQFTPDGKYLLFVKQISPSTGDQLYTQIEKLELASGKYAPLTSETTLVGYPVVSPDGAHVAYWRARDGKPYQFQDVLLAGAPGGPGRDVTAALDKNLFLTRWMPDGRTLLVGGNIDTTVGFWLQPLAGAARRLDLGDVVPVNGYWIEAAVGPAGQIAFVGQTPSDPDEIYVMPGAGSAPAAITDANAALAAKKLAKAERVVWDGPMGRKLDGVLTYPLGYQAGQPYPLVLVVHGGPNSSSRLRFSLFDQVLAGHGWLVFEPNYRGSDNQDNAFYASIYRDAGQGPGEDVMSGVAYLQGKGLVDASRMAVTGWSYGGFMTVWLEGHYNVWKAAVAGAAVTDWLDMYNLGDANVLIGPQQFGGSPYVGDGMAEYRRESPDASLGKIRAPTLVLSNTGDFRVPMTESFGLYRALKDNGVETQFIAYPMGGHFPSDPVKQMDVYQRWTDWVAAHLK